MAFGLITTGQGMPTRAVKNFTMCSKCHTFAKLMSKLYIRKSKFVLITSILFSTEDFVPVEVIGGGITKKQFTQKMKKENTKIITKRSLEAQYYNSTILLANLSQVNTKSHRNKG